MNEGSSGPVVERLHALEPRHIESLADILTDCVEGLASIGFMLVGTIPGYALLPQGGLCDTVVFYRHLTRPEGLR